MKNANAKSHKYLTHTFSDISIGIDINAAIAEANCSIYPESRSILMSSGAQKLLVKRGYIEGKSLEFVETVPDAMILSDHQGRITLWQGRRGISR